MASSIPSNFASVGDDVESFVVKTQPQPRNEPGLMAKWRTMTTFAFLPATSPHSLPPPHPSCTWEVQLHKPANRLIEGENLES